MAFSKNALVRRVGDLGLCLVLRVANMRRSHLIEAHVRAVLFIDQDIKQEGALKGQELKVWRKYICVPLFLVIIIYLIIYHTNL